MTIAGTPTELLIEGPGALSLTASGETADASHKFDSAALVIVYLAPVGCNRASVVEVNLDRWEASPGDRSAEEWYEWRYRRQLWRD